MITKDSFPSDKQLLKLLHERVMKMPFEDVKRMCEGLMNASVVAQDVFKKRFPVEYAEWEKNDEFWGGEQIP